MNVPTKFEVRRFIHSWDNRGHWKHLGSPWIRPCSLFSQICNGLSILLRQQHSATCTNTTQALNSQ